MPELNLTQVSGIDGPRIKALSDTLFGEGYTSIEGLMDYCSNGHGLVAMDGDTLAGFSLFRPLEIAELKDHLLLDEDWIHDSFPAGPVGLRRATGVRPSYRKMQLGPRLVRESMERMNELKAIVSVVWDQEGKHIGPLLERYGMEVAEEIEGYWGADSVARNYNCPVCGAPPCTCKAYIYVRYNDK